MNIKNRLNKLENNNNSASENCTCGIVTEIWTQDTKDGEPYLQKGQTLMPDVCGKCNKPIRKIMLVGVKSDIPKPDGVRNW